MRYIEIGLDENLEVIKKEIITVKVVAENKTQLVVDGTWKGFTILDKERVKKGRTQFNSVVEDISLSDYSKDKFFRENWGYIVVRLYTDSTSDKVLTNKINREVNKHIKKMQSEYRLYCGNKVCKVSL